MPKGTKEPRHGYRPCVECGTKIPLKIQRDLDRKRFCSKSCRSRYAARKNIETGVFPPVLDQETKERRTESLRITLSLHHPMQGRVQSEESRRKVSNSQRKRLANHPEKILRGSDHPNWTGGRRVNKPGYVVMLVKGRYKLEHRVIAERMLGRPLNSNEHVHHRNKNRQDNREENLEVMESSKHISMHMKERWSAKKLTSG